DNWERRAWCVHGHGDVGCRYERHPEVANRHWSYLTDNEDSWVSVVVCVSGIWRSDRMPDGAYYAAGAVCGVNVHKLVTTDPDVAMLDGLDVLQTCVDQWAGEYMRVQGELREQERIRAEIPL